MSEAAPFEPSSDKKKNSPSSSRWGGNVPRILPLATSGEGVLHHRLPEAPFKAPMMGEVAAPTPEIDDDEADDDDEKPARAAVAEEVSGVGPAESAANLGSDAAVREQFERIMAREMDGSFVQAASGEQLEASAPTAAADAEELPSEPAEAVPLYTRAEQPPVPPEDADEHAPPASSGSSGSGSGGSGTPPPPPPSPPSGGANFNYAPSPITPNRQPFNPAFLRPNLAPAVPRPERDSIAFKLLAAFIAGYAVKGYLAGKKLERAQQEHRREQAQSQEDIGRLRTEQQRIQERFNARPEFAPASDARRPEQVAASQPKFEEPPKPQPPAEVLPPVKPVNETLLDEQGNEVVLQPGWHEERSAGGYRTVLNERGEVVYDAVHYGEAYQRDRKREQVDPTAFGNVDDGAAGAVGSDSFAPLTSAGSAPSPELQVYDWSSADANQPTPIDPQHRLSEPRHPVVSALTNPWLWTAIALLLIIYFIAALA